MECHKLTAADNGIDCNRLDELCTQQEEADTRILLHTSHVASDGHACIAIKSPRYSCGGLCVLVQSQHYYQDAILYRYEATKEVP